jgi:hypothetical protein
MSDQKLDPKEVALVNEGESLLKAAQAQKAASSPILGPDGTPMIATEGGKAAPVMAPQMSLQEMMQRYRDAREKRILKNSRELKRIFEHDAEASRVRDVMYLCHQLLYWGRMELSGHDEIDDEMLDDMDEIIKSSILSNAKGYNLKQVTMRMQTLGLKYLKEFIRKYEDMGKVRKFKIDKVFKKLGEKGITLPSKKMTDACGTSFMPGKVCMLVGAPEATRAMLDLVQKSHIEKDGGKVYRLSTMLDENGLAKSENVITMASAWWRNCCVDLKKRDETLGPIVDSSAFMVLVEDLESLYVTDDKNLNPIERKSYALKRMYQWAVENLVAVVIADNPAEDLYDPKMYGFIPAVFVKLKGSNVLEVNRDEEIQI